MRQQQRRVAKNRWYVDPAILQKGSRARPTDGADVKKGEVVRIDGYLSIYAATPDDVSVSGKVKYRTDTE